MQLEFVFILRDAVCDIVKQQKASPQWGRLLVTLNEKYNGFRKLTRFASSNLRFNTRQKL